MLAVRKASCARTGRRTGSELGLDLISYGNYENARDDGENLLYVRRKSEPEEDDDPDAEHYEYLPFRHNNKGIIAYQPFGSQ